jgi:hypothetical protein
MNLRNLVIAAGATLAVGGAVAAPAAATAQDFYRPVYRPAPVAFHYGYANPYAVERRIEARRYWEHRRFEDYRFHHEYRPYRGW